MRKCGIKGGMQGGITGEIGGVVDLVLFSRLSYGVVDLLSCRHDLVSPHMCTAVHDSQCCSY
jgi:hypothetical protein